MIHKILLFTLFSTLLFAQTDWQPFTSVDGRFSVLAPGEFQHKENSIDTEIGEITYHSYVYQSPDPGADNLVYMISYCDYPENSIHSDSTGLVEDFFKETLESATFSVEGDLVYSAAITLNDYPGRIWRIHYNQGEASIKSKAFLIKNRFYNVQAITLSDKKLNTQADKFLDSFKVIF